MADAGTSILYIHEPKHNKIKLIDEKAHIRKKDK